MGFFSTSEKKEKRGKKEGKKNGEKKCEKIERNIPMRPSEAREQKILGCWWAGGLVGGWAGQKNAL